MRLLDAMPPIVDTDPVPRSNFWHTRQCRDKLGPNKKKVFCCTNQTAVLAVSHNFVGTTACAAKR